MIPGDHAGKRAVLYRITIGDPPKVKGRDGPTKRDYFVVKKLHPSGNGNWIPAPEVQEKLVEWAGDDKPMRAPIMLVSDAIEENLFSGLAWHGRRHRYCWASDFKGVSLDEEEATAHCLVAKFDKPNSMTARHWQEIVKYHHSVEHPCRPTSCPNWQTKNPAFKCRPFGYLRFLLLVAPSFPTMAEFRSPGWASNIALHNALVDIRRELGGKLAGVPLHLRMWWKRSETESGVFVNPAVTLEFPGDVLEFRKFAVKYLERRAELEAKYQQIANSMKPLPAFVEEGEDEGRLEAYADEFLPQAEDLREEPDDLEARFNRIADALEWTEAKRAAIRDGFDSLESAIDYANNELQMAYKDKTQHSLFDEEESN